MGKYSSPSVLLLTPLSILLLWRLSSSWGVSGNSVSLNASEAIEEITEWKSEFFMYVMETTPSLCSEAEASSSNVTRKLVSVRKLMELSPDETLAKFGTLHNVKVYSAPLFSELSGGVSVMCSLKGEQACVQDKCVKCKEIEPELTNNNNIQVICEEALKLNEIYNKGLMEMARESKKTAQRILKIRLKGRGKKCEDNSLQNQVELGAQVNFFLDKSEEEIVKGRVEVSGDFQTGIAWRNRLKEMEEDAGEMCSMISNEKLVCLEGICKGCEDTSEEMKEILNELGYCETEWSREVTIVTSSGSVGIVSGWMGIMNLVLLVVVLT